MTSNDLFLWTSHREQDCPYVKNAGERPSNQANKQSVAKVGRSAFPEILAELLLIRNISFNIHVEIADEIEVHMYFIGRYCRAN